MSSRTTTVIAWTSDIVAPVLFGLALICPEPLAAQEEVDGAPQSPGTVWVAFPEADFYPYHVADPLRSHSALIVTGVADSDIPETGDARFILRLGGRFPLFRRHPAGAPQTGIQLDFEGGFFGHFDMDYSLDNIGWDGLFGLVLSWKPTSDLGLRFGRLHDSAHVGDEYAERTGRTRIGYTREEWVLGVGWRVAPAWTVYAEWGYAPGVDDPQRASRVQAGGEWTGAHRFWGDRAHWYAALDVRAYEETDWDLRTTLQGGIMWPLGEGTRRYRFALEVIDGPSVLGEFFSDSETTVGVGWYFDF